MVRRNYDFFSADIDKIIGSTRRDKPYRRYASSIDRALSLFDSALQEWADYIAFLGRLLRVCHCPVQCTSPS